MLTHHAEYGEIRVHHFDNPPTGTHRIRFLEIPHPPFALPHSQRKRRQVPLSQTRDPQTTHLLLRRIGGRRVPRSTRQQPESGSIHGAGSHCHVDGSTKHSLIDRIEDISQSPEAEDEKRGCRTWQRSHQQRNGVRDSEAKPFSSGGCDTPLEEGDGAQQDSSTGRSRSRCQGLRILSLQQQNSEHRCRRSSSATLCA